MFEISTTKLYSQARKRARQGKVWSLLTGGPKNLASMAEIGAASQVRARHYRGLTVVPIDLIRGSEGRSQDFDRNFNPLKDHNRSRWLIMAKAWVQGKTLPPVELIKVGEFYFVRDGHHRISVARALGQLDIEAEVTVLQMSAPVPPHYTAPANALPAPA